MGTRGSPWAGPAAQAHSPRRRTPGAPGRRGVVEPGFGARASCLAVGGRLTERYTELTMAIEPLPASGSPTAPPAAGARLAFSPRALDALERRLEAELRAHHPNADLAPVGEAYRFAVEAHEGQKRASGEPYVTHPLAVAQVLAELGMDPAAIQAALLHDIPEDTVFSNADLEE